MSEENAVERPTPVSVIGWIWLVFAGYILLRSILNLVIWKALGPLRPTLLELVRQRAPEVGRASLLLRYAPMLDVIKLVFAAFAALASWHLLKLRSWARIAMQAIGWIQLAYVASFAVFWAWLWPRVAAAKAHQFGTHSYAGLGLAAGLAVCAGLGAALVAQILLLRAGRVREAFDAAGAATNA